MKTEYNKIIDRILEKDMERVKDKSRFVRRKYRKLLLKSLSNSDKRDIRNHVEKEKQDELSGQQKVKMLLIKERYEEAKELRKTLKPFYI
jgi:hypothetical protein